MLCASVYAVCFYTVHACMFIPLQRPEPHVIPCTPPSLRVPSQVSTCGLMPEPSTLFVRERSAERVSSGRNLLVSAQSLMYRAHVVLLLRGLITWFFAPSPFSNTGSPSRHD